VIAAALPPGADVVAPDLEFTSVLFPFLARGDLRVRLVALDELAAAMQRGWSDRDCRVAMTLQEERANVSVRVSRERLQDAMD
jgi:hypothetical protein